MIGLFLTLFVVGSASAISFENTVNFDDVFLGEGSIASVLLPTEYSYTHDTPSDFEVPPDTVTSATLTISGYWIDGNDDTVEVEATSVGYLNAGGSYGYDCDWDWGTWTWTSIWYEEPSISMFDVSTVFETWEAGASLDVTITAEGAFWDGVLQLSSSTFKLEYENGSDPSGGAHAPEPATMVLFGLGLLGVAGMSRKKS